MVQGNTNWCGLWSTDMVVIGLIRLKSCCIINFILTQVTYLQGKDDLDFF